jgi:hypothetical protein
MLAQLKRLLGVKGSSHGGEISPFPMLQARPVGSTFIPARVERQPDGSLKIYVPQSATIEARDFAGNLLLYCSPSAEPLVIVGLPDPKPPV